MVRGRRSPQTIKSLCNRTKAATFFSLAGGTLGTAGTPTGAKSQTRETPYGKKNSAMSMIVIVGFLFIIKSEQCNRAGDVI